MISELYHELNGECLILTPTNILVDRFKELRCNQCITYNLLHKRINSYEFTNKYSKVKYLLLDEVHRLGNNKWTKSLNKFLTKNNFKIIGFTATPKRPNDSINVIDTIFNGIQVDSLYLGDSYNLKFIDKIKYILAYYNIRDVERNLISNYNVNINDFKIDNIFYIEDIIRKHYNPKNNGTKIIVFCPKVKELDNYKNKFFQIFSNIYKDWNINTYTISYKDRDNKSLYKFKESKENTIDLIFTVNKLNEGVHINQVNTVIFMRPTESSIIYLQQLGRSMNNKESLVFDFSNNLITRKKTKPNSSIFYSYNNKSKIINENKLVEEKQNDFLLYLVDYITPIKNFLDNIYNMNKSKFFENLELTDEDKQYIKDNSNKLYFSAMSSHIIRTRNIPLSKCNEVRKLISSYCDENKLRTKVALRGSFEYKTRLEQIKRLASKNSILEISNKTNIPIGSVRQIIKENQISYGDLAYTRMSEHTRLRINDLYNLCSKYEICSLLKISNFMFDSFVGSSEFKPKY